MAWPDHVKAGEVISARAMVNEIIAICELWLEDPWVGEEAREYYRTILGHALLERVNHAHGLLRNLVDAAGNGKPPNPVNNLDTAWAQVRAAYDNVTKPSPSLFDLQTALDGIDHGGGG